MNRLKLKRDSYGRDKVLWKRFCFDGPDELYEQVVGPLYIALVPAEFDGGREDRLEYEWLESK